MFSRGVCVCVCVRNIREEIFPGRSAAAHHVARDHHRRLEDLTQHCSVYATCVCGTMCVCVCVTMCVCHYVSHYVYACVCVCHYVYAGGVYVCMPLCDGIRFPLPPSSLLELRLRSCVCVTWHVDKNPNVILCM